MDVKIKREDQLIACPWRVTLGHFFGLVAVVIAGLVVLVAAVLVGPA